MKPLKRNFKTIVVRYLDLVIVLIIIVTKVTLDILDPFSAAKMNSLITPALIITVIVQLIKLSAKFDGYSVAPFENLGALKQNKIEVLERIKTYCRDTKITEKHVYMQGYQLRTIGIIWRNLLDDIRDDISTYRRIVFDIYCINPFFLDTMVTTGDSQDDLEYLDYMKQLAIIEDEIAKLKKDKINISLHKYNTYPKTFVFLLKDEEILYGDFAYNKHKNKRSDFDLHGEESCLYSLKKAESGLFLDMQASSINYFEFLQETFFKYNRRSGSVPIDIDLCVSVITHSYNTFSSNYIKRSMNEKVRSSVTSLCKQLLDKISKSKDIRALDVGAGAGISTFAMAELGVKMAKSKNKPPVISVTSIECAQDLFNHIRDMNKKRRYTNVKLINSDIFRHDISTKYDIIIAMAFIHLYPKQYFRYIIERMIGMLSENGVLYISTTKETTSKNNWELKDGYVSIRWRARYTEPEFEKSLEETPYKWEKFAEDRDPIEDKTWIGYIVTQHAD